MNLRQDLIKISNVISNDKTLARLLYYDKDPLSPTKADVDTLPDYSAIRKSRILRAPKTDDITTQQICRVCMYMGNRYKTSNPKFSDQDLVIDVFVHIDKYDMNDARALWICDRINELLSYQPVTSGWKMLSDKMMIIGNVPDGYIGYKLIYSFSSERY